MKLKKCKNCGEQFKQFNSLCVCCEVDCAIAYAATHTKKEVAKEKRSALKAFNDSDKNVLKRKAIQVFNAYIRKRDEKLPCVSCGCEVKKNMAHASHFKPANTYSYLRFDESNVHKSCSRCNLFLSGNLDQYRIRIVERIGQIELDRLDKPNQVKNWTIEEYADIIATYKLKIKEL